MPDVLTAYCLKEKAKNREMVDIVVKVNKKGKEYVMGKCAVCGSPMAKLGADAVTLARKLGAKKGGRVRDVTRKNPRRAVDAAVVVIAGNKLRVVISLQLGYIHI